MFPPIGVEFGAAGDANVRVRPEGDPLVPPFPYEGTCTLEAQQPPFNSCTWKRWWKRRFAAFNRGSDDSTSFENYGKPIVDNAGTFAPQPSPQN
jgi:hypothetical protein